jgi:hypothetical protein
MASYPPQPDRSDRADESEGGGVARASGNGGEGRSGLQSLKTVGLARCGLNGGADEVQGDVREGWRRLSE